MESLIGSEIIDHNDSKVSVSAFKYVGLYFSAHWCPPCRSFTPQLAKFYTDFKKEHPSDFEIVFISCDNDEDSFKSYFKEMPWLSLPFDSPFKEEAGKKFGIEGIPALVLLDGQTGSVIRKNARGMIEKDPTGQNFPWSRSGNIETIIGTDIIGKDGNKVTLSAKYVGLYFSAHWCPPCRAFTPKLSQFYTDFNQKRPGELEIVFVSLDNDENSFKDYYNEMPWLSLPFSSALKEQLGEEFEVEGIPTLVIIDRSSSAVIQAEGTTCVMQDPTGDNFPWKEFSSN